MAEAWAINAAAGAPEYNAQELRRLQSVHLFAGVSDRFGARQGMRPTGQDVVSASGATWTQRDLTAVVYPGLTTISGPYVVEKAEESGNFDPADGSNDRIDALDVQVRDDDEDASTFRDVRVVYVAGTPASTPAEPALTANALRIGTFLVSAGGTPSPTVRTQAQYTVAAGGVLPLRDGEAKPTTGVADGSYVDQNGALWRRAGASWLPVGTSNAPEAVLFTSSGSFTKADYPWGRYVVVETQGAGGGGGGAATTGADQGAAGGGGGSGGYARKTLALADLSTSETVTVGTGGSGGISGPNDGSSGGNSSFGAHLSATGGGGGEGGSAVGSTITFGGAGGGGVSGDINITGSDGTGGIVAASGAAGSVMATGGYGGVAHLGGGRRSNSADGGAVGRPGYTFGGGGSGGYNSESAGGARVGGAGADGCVLVTVH